MSLKKFLKNKRVNPHTSSAKEIKDLLRIVDRDINDSGIQGLSTDRKFTTAYNAALQLATIVLHAAGYRSSGTGHHWITFKALPDVMGKQIEETAYFFETCRRKRNTTDYDRAGEISSSEADDLHNSVKEFKEKVMEWLRAHHSELID